MNLSTNVKISTAITPTDGAAGTADINGTILDMMGFEGVLMVVRFGAITGSAVTSIKAQQDTASGGGTMADLEGTSITVADDDDDQIFIIDLYRPQERYVRLVVDRGTQNAVVASAEYIQYGPRSLPTDNNVDDAVTCELHVSPDEGTA
ncbi:MAG: hypothetical protein KKA73_14200 [Chloroflexi bacterium]|nr:hypothetical protein [Chloroflexota bacterium]MBU1748837.1 hypothetical protein [Chloroflexota bacterium]